MRSATVLLSFASTTAIAQEISSANGPSIIASPNAISGPNVNFGWQSGGSLFAEGSRPGQSSNGFNSIIGSSISNIKTSDVSRGNTINNPSQSHIKGGDGWAASGETNQLGPVHSTSSAGGFIHCSNDVVLSNNGGKAAPDISRFVPPGFVSGRFATPVGGSAFVPPRAVNNGIINGTHRRSSDVLFANGQRQASAVAGSGYGGFAGPQFALATIHPMVAEQSGQKNHCHPEPGIAQRWGARC
ncbi:hypothetical protein DL89DRAFT_254668 [Linderina pennispora]|uniref:Uncharacterized protein n=1 Tax=Linderina pennispora TaxID=61395 RepID=A0A1Y1WMX8_9FUNG|nr:uncharacterized protein DL89DRAFT_254668 [Linderina pennispora]ORX74901.1 hypothetical protein DL89DRAFT_254668 [Linderina pennispora]